jgi:hypothetical protein
MEAVRRGARAVLKYLIALYLVLVIVQIYLAGEGIFGGTEDPIEDADILEPHRALGFFLGFLGGILLLIVALLAWHPVKKIRWWSIALAFILVIQTFLPEGGRWIGGLHPLNAVFILAILGYLASRLWRRHAEPVTPM